MAHPGVVDLPASDLRLRPDLLAAGMGFRSVAITRAGFPMPLLQWEVRTADGRWVAQVDFGWPELRTVGEFDGRVKYGRLLQPGQSAADVVYAEKLREDDVRAEDLSMVRWGWDDLDHFAPTAARLRRSFAR